MSPERLRELSDAKCERCFFFEKSIRHGTPSYEGRCHRYPPEGADHAPHQKVKSTQWCGEFQLGPQHMQLSDL